METNYILRRCDGAILRMTKWSGTASRWVKTGGVSLSLSPYDNEGPQYVEKIVGGEVIWKKNVKIEDEEIYL